MIFPDGRALASEIGKCPWCSRTEAAIVADVYTSACALKEAGSKDRRKKRCRSTFLVTLKLDMIEQKVHFCVGWFQNFSMYVLCCFCFSFSCGAVVVFFDHKTRGAAVGQATQCHATLWGYLLLEFSWRNFTALKLQLCQFMPLWQGTNLFQPTSHTNISPRPQPQPVTSRLAKNWFGFGHVLRPNAVD